MEEPQENNQSTLSDSFKAIGTFAADTKEPVHQNNRASMQFGLLNGSATSLQYANPFSLLGGGNDAGGGGGYGYGYGGGGGGGGGMSPEASKAMNKFNFDTIYGNRDNMNKAYDEALEDIGKQAVKQGRNAEKAAGQEWFSRYQKLAQATERLRDSAGQLINSSGWMDVMSKIGEQLDADSVDVLEALGQNMFNIEADKDTQQLAIDNSKRELAANTWMALRNAAGQAVSDGLANGTSEDDLIDKDNLDLKIPDYLGGIKSYDQMKPEARNYDFVNYLYRPNAAWEATQLEKKQPNKINTSSATNPDYFKSLLPYAKRNVSR